MMQGFTDKEYTEYMLANYILGYIDTSIFIAANMFEKYFKETVSVTDVNKRKKQLKAKYDLDLKGYIDLYTENYHYYSDDVLYSREEDLNEKLNKFRKLRNEFIHGMDDNKIIEKRRFIGEFVSYVYFSFNKDIKYDPTIIYDESTKNLILQDYKIREVTERMIDRLEKQKMSSEATVVSSFKSIKYDDFGNLFELRKKLRYIQVILERKFKNVDIVPTILSPIDTTSAYIWMPFVDREFTDNKNKYMSKRNNLLMGSCSILATPLELRIYIDFGGGDFEYRLAYQNFLLQDNTIEYLKKLSKRNKKNLKLFDVRWYSFITKCDNLLDAIESNKIKTYGREAIEKIKDDEKNHKIITSGYNRIGYILPASDIDIDCIVDLFRNMLDLYYEFLKYKFIDDADCHLLNQSQEILRNLIKS